VTLNDILAVEEQNSDQIDGLINFLKQQHLFKLVVTIEAYQQCPYNLQPVQQIAVFLNSFPKRDEMELTLLSQQCDAKK